MTQDNNPHGDVPIKQAAQYLAGLAALGFDQLKLEWTCGGCGERAVHNVVVREDKTLVFHNRYGHGFKADGNACDHTTWVHEALFQPSAVTNSLDDLNKFFDSQE